MLAPLTAQQTLDRARTVMQSGRGAALPELLKIIETLSRNVSAATISDLADLIAKDPVVLAKIISVANTLAHNPSIAPLTSLSQAIHQLGFNRIRTLAVSLMLFDTAGGGANPPEQREAAAHALCAGLLAQGTAEWLGTHDPEFAFACTALRHLGRIVLASCSVEHCRMAARRTAEVGEASAYREQFGLTPLDFTRRLLTATGLPEDVLHTLRECDPAALGGVATTYDARLLGIVDFGSRLAALTLDERLGPADYVPAIHALAQRSELLVPGAPDIMKPALQRTDERLRSMSSCHGVRQLPTRSLHRIRARLEQIAATKTAPPADAEPDVAPITPPAPAAAVATVSPEATRLTSGRVAPPGESTPAAQVTAIEWDSGLLDSAAFESAPLAAPPADPMHDALVVVRDGLGAQEAWLFVDRATAGAFTFTRGIGPGWTHVKDHPALRAEDRSVFGVCLTRSEIVLIHDAADAALQPYLPAWLRDAVVAPAAFALIPLRSAGTPAGLLLVGWNSPRRIVLSVAHLTLARQLLAAALPEGAARAA